MGDGSDRTQKHYGSPCDSDQIFLQHGPLALLLIIPYALYLFVPAPLYLFMTQVEVQAQARAGIGRAGRCR